MDLNSSIFNDVVNLNSKWENIEDPRKRAEVAEQYDEAVTAVVAKDSADEISDSVKAYQDSNSEDAEDARNDATMEAVNESLSDGLQINFVPDNSTLGCALKAYYAHVDTSKPKEYTKEFVKFARSAVNSEDVSTPVSDHNPGFFYATGIGYDSRDDLFLGVPRQKNAGNTNGVGSGVPTKKFFEYINGSSLSGHDAHILYDIQNNLNGMADYLNDLYKKQGGNLNKIGANQSNADAERIQKIINKNK